MRALRRAVKTGLTVSLNIEVTSYTTIKILTLLVTSLHKILSSRSLSQTNRGWSYPTYVEL